MAATEAATPEVLGPKTVFGKWMAARPGLQGPDPLALVEQFYTSDVVVNVRNARHCDTVTDNDQCILFPDPLPPPAHLRRPPARAVRRSARTRARMRSFFRLISPWRIRTRSKCTTGRRVCSLPFQRTRVFVLTAACQPDRSARVDNQPCEPRRDGRLHHGQDDRGWRHSDVQGEAPVRPRQCGPRRPPRRTLELGPRCTLTPRCRVPATPN